MRATMGRNVAANLITVAATVGANLVSIPLILDRVGLAGLGLWTLAQTVLIYVTTAEAGFGPAVQRFVSVAHGRRRDDEVRCLLWSTAGLYVAVGVLAALALQPAAPALVGVFSTPPDLTGEAEDLFRLVGPVLLTSLLGASLSNVLTGLERFVALAITAAISSVAFLVALSALFALDYGLTAIAWAALAQQLTLLFGRMWAMRNVIRLRRPFLLSWSELKLLLSFSARLQMNVLGTIVNTQTDKVVVGLLARASTVGQLGIATQAAEASRLLLGSALGPIVSRLAVAHGAGDDKELARLYGRLGRLWSLTVIGTTVILAISTYPLLAAWLGPGQGSVAVLAALLIVAYGFNMLTGAGVAYLRAIGSPGLEARTGLLTILLNLLLTAVFGLLAGPVGVVLATASAYAISTAWFFYRLRSLVPVPPERAPHAAVRVITAAVAAGGAALVWGLAMTEILPAGISLLPVAAGIGLAFVIYLSQVTGVRPTFANAKVLIS